MLMSAHAPSPGSEPSSAPAETSGSTSGASGSKEEGRSADQTPRLLAWASKRSVAVPGWFVPVVVIAVTGLLGRVAQPELVCYWLGAVGAVVAYTLVTISFDPAPYSRFLGGASAIVLALLLTQLLLHHLGGSLLSA